MRLARVDIKGFKSIAKKTVLTFPGQVTCICGPNGCGKSNVIDAIRWAIGEQSARTLRAGNMSDVIFAGTQETPQAGMARVTLEFSRDGGYWPASLEGFETIAVARRLYRTGESSYTINDVKCRLKDVADLFMDTGLTRHGYAIIGQGRIKDIIQAKPEDMRYLIEEAADVGRFRLKRSEALRRLEAASLNLERIQDLLGEVLKQRNSLKNQAAKARRYQELRAQHNQLTLYLWSHELLGLEQLERAAAQELAELRLKRGQLNEKIEASDSVLRQILARRGALKARLDESELLVQEGRNQLELALSRISAAQTRLDDIATSQTRLSARINELETGLDEGRSQLAAAAAGTTQLEQELGQTEAALELSETGLNELSAAGAELVETYEQARASVYEVLGEQRALEQRQSALLRRRQETAANLSRRQAELNELDQSEIQLKRDQAAALTEAAALEVRLSGLRASLVELEERAAELRAARETAQQRLLASEKAEAETRAKVSVLARLLEGQPSAPAAGPRLRALIKPKPGFEETVGRALGSALDYALVETHEDIAEIAGCPGFIPRETVIAEAAELAGTGLIAPLHECLTTEDENATRSVTQNCWVVEDLASASAIWRAARPTASLITLNGLVLEPSGVVRNTSARHGELLKAEAEHAELLQQLGPLGRTTEGERRELDELRGQLKTVRERQPALQARLSEDERQHQRLQAKADELAGRLERLATRRQNFTTELDNWRDLELRLEAEEQSLLGEQSDLSLRLESRQQVLRELEARRGQDRSRLEQARAQVQADSARLSDVRVRLAALRTRHKSLQEELARREAELDGDRERLTELATTRASIAAQLDEAQSQHAECATSLEQRLAERADIVPAYAELGERGAGQELELEELRRQKNGLEQLEAQLNLRRKEHEISRSMRLERLQARFDAGPVNPPADFDEAGARERAAEVQAVIEGLGQINFTSIEAHEEAQNRYDEIHRQYEDLIQATAKLKEVIQGCERESNKAFMATFVKVRANFQEIFATMFDGGRADLVLEDGDEAGVEIFACPPHKKPKTMSLLSEGEKTLCALSFIFALFKVKPSPFCVMDEVDAPLDDANVERMLRLIRSFAGETQFLVVTHNRRTMEMADIIYGVTFDVPGITKLVSLNLKEADDRAA